MEYECSVERREQKAQEIVQGKNKTTQQTTFHKMMKLTGIE